MYLTCINNSDTYERTDCRTLIRQFACRFTNEMSCYNPVFSHGRTFNHMGMAILLRRPIASCPAGRACRNILCCVLTVRTTHRKKGNQAASQYHDDSESPVLNSRMPHARPTSKFERIMHAPPSTMPDI
jgi:hypothetical protein